MAEGTARLAGRNRGVDRAGDGPVEKIGIDEPEWRDDPESLADWETWIKTIEPFELTPDEAKRNADFAERMRQYNVEAVRRQMRQGAAG